MGATSGNKLCECITLAEQVVAIELLNMAAALDHHRPLVKGDAVERVYGQILLRRTGSDADRPPVRRTLKQSSNSSASVDWDNAAPGASTAIPCTHDNYDFPDIQAPRGTERVCKSWQAEAAMRMLMNNLDPEVAELPGRSRRLRRPWPGGPVLGGLRGDHRILEVT